VLLGQLEQGGAATDLDIVGVGSDTQDALDAKK